MNPGSHAKVEGFQALSPEASSTGIALSVAGCGISSGGFQACKVEEQADVADELRIGPGEVVADPSDPSLMSAEPIWTTATRQGIKTLVHDWPLSQSQTGDNAAALSLDSYNDEATEEERLNAAQAAWRGSVPEGAEPAADGSERLRLVICSISGDVAIARESLFWGVPEPHGRVHNSRLEPPEPHRAPR